MTQNKNRNILYTLYGYGMSRFLPTSGFKWIDPKHPLALDKIEIKKVLSNYQLN